jgi:DNA-binding transcriptional regulator YbjK
MRFDIMNTVEDIQHALAQLAESERRVVKTWLDELMGSGSNTVKETAALYGSLELHAIQTAVQQLDEQQRRELRDWLEAVDEDETPEMLAAIDEGLRSLETEPTISIEDMRREIASWSTR